MKLLLLTACCLSFAAPPASAAIYRCTQPDGRTIYQEVPCDKGTQKAVVNRDTRGDDPVSQDELPRAGSTERRIMVNEAIANGQPLIGMTRAELDQAAGKPSRTKTRLDGSVVREQLFYGGDGFVELEQGTVVGIDSGTATKKEAVAPEKRAAPKKACLDEYAMRKLRVDIDNTYNRDNKQLQKKLRKQLDDAMACQA